MLEKGEDEKKDKEGTTTPETSGNGEYSPEGLQGEIYQYLLSKGMDDAHALGLMANISRESGFRPGVLEEGGGGGVGLFQYTNEPRKGNFLKAVPNYKTNWKGQIDYALKEPGEPGQQYLSTKFSSPQEAADWFMRKWERPDETIQNVSGPKIHAEYLAGLQKYRTKKGSSGSFDFGGMDKGGVGGSVAEYITGDPNTPFGRFDRAGHGTTGNYHDHLAFNDKATTQRAYNFFKSKGFQVTELNVSSGHSDGSLHYSGRAFDVPGAQWGGSGAIGQTEYKGSAKVRTALKEFLGGSNVKLAKGGRISKPTRALIGERGAEFIFDADTTRGLDSLAPNLLEYLNAAKTKSQ
jgi:hypothetical protein